MKLNMIFHIIFIIVSVNYLVSLFFKRGLFRDILKCFLVPLILAIYIFSAEKILLPVVLALVLGWAGDILLLEITDLQRFRLGLLSFLLGHICYIIAMYGFAMPLNITVLCISIAAAAVFGFCTLKIIRPSAEMKIPVFIYMFIILTMSVFALQVLVSQGSPFGALVFAGSLCFLVSDSLLAFDTFRKKTTAGYFMVMLTYIAAQFLITLGFCAGSFAA